VLNNKERISLRIASTITLNDPKLAGNGTVPHEHPAAVLFQDLEWYEGTVQALAEVGLVSLD
jgi:hypothetical protein